MAIHIVVMGVSGCGKSTVAEAIHNRLGLTMIEGDDFHPQTNIDKMHAGSPLNDNDRWPWLRAINTWMYEQEGEGVNTVVSCSALKRAYRDVLREHVPVYFLHLSGSRELISERLTARQGHFMPVTLLNSQFATLEPLQSGEQGIEIPIDGDIDEVIERSVATVAAYMTSSML